MSFQIVSPGSLQLTLENSCKIVLKCSQLSFGFTLGGIEWMSQSVGHFGSHFGTLFASFLVSRSVILDPILNPFLKLILELLLEPFLHHFWSVGRSFWIPFWNPFWPELSNNVKKRRPFCPAGRPGTGRDSLKKSRPVPSRGKNLSLSHCPFVPEQNKFPCPAVPLSRDKSSSKNPRTRSSVPGHPAGQSHLLFFPLMLFSEWK